MRKLIFSIPVICFALACVRGNTQSATQQPTPTPAATASASAPANTAKPGDVDTVEHILAATYDVISGPAGPRDWDRFRSLFYPGAHLIPTHRDDKTGVVSAHPLTPDEYATRGQAFFDKEGFFENSMTNRIETWDSIAHVWSTYESRHAKGEKPFARGINSFQLLNDGKRWWVMNIYWEAEDATHPLPEKYTKQ